MNDKTEYKIKFRFEPLKELVKKIFKKLDEFKSEHIWPEYVVSDDAKSLMLILEKRMNQMALNVEALAAEVTRVQTVHESAIKFIAKLTDELKVVTEDLKAKNAEVIDTSALDELVAKLDASTDALAAAIATSEDNPVEAPVEDLLMEETVPEPVVEEPMEEVAVEEVEEPVAEEEKPAE